MDQELIAYFDRRFGEVVRETRVTIEGLREHVDTQIRETQGLLRAHGATQLRDPQASTNSR